MSPLVSVLMTAYNREKYIAEAIESVLAQTFTDFEMIIVDDGSKDRTVEIARRYAELIKLGRQKEYKFKEPYKGKECMVLFEASKQLKQGKLQCSGYTPNYLRVLVERDDHQVGQTLSGNELPVLIECLGDDLNLKGRVLS